MSRRAVSVWVLMLRRRIEDIYRTRLPELLRVAAATCGSREAAPDLVQEAFARALREADSFDGRGSFDGWVWRIVTNVALNYRRDARTVVELTREIAAAESAPTPDAEVARIVSALPEQQRLVLFLRYYADLDYRTIAAALEISPGTVGATLHAARAALLTRLEAKEAVR
jgi:RNA polymerase sigma factor (sigma-70 family)